MFEATLRHQPEKIRAQGEEILKSPYFSQLLGEVPVVLLIINDARQVIYVNKDLLAGVSGRDPGLFLGQRPGECLECVHALEGDFGCGSTAYCRVCGLANTIELSEDGKNGHGECSIALKGGESLTLKVHAKPFRYGKDDFVFVALEDISDRKARLMLENIFLHDLRNTSAILSGLTEVFEDLEIGEAKRILKDVSVRIDEEIKSYRLISSAENQQLLTHSSIINLPDILQEVIHSLQLNQKFSRKQVVYSGERQIIRTDKTLLRQVLVNMVKNAMEAGPAVDRLAVRHRLEPGSGRVIIQVENSQVIPPDIQLKIFQKSFSTKGPGRGWGTYGIKLLTEKYLKGKAGFTSTEAEGTIFSISLPERLNGNTSE